MKIRPVLNEQLFLATAYVETPDGSVAGGACDPSSGHAAVRARGEAVERASLIHRGPELVISRDEALRRGLTPMAPYEHLHESRDWVPARHAATGEGAALPADVALLGRTSGMLPWKQSSVGAAAHVDADAAVTSGILECLERYAIRRVWAGTAVLAPATERLRATMTPELAEALDEHRLSAYAWDIGDLAPVRVCLALVCRQDRAQATFGAGSGLDGDEGLMHALCEAISVRAALAGPAAAADERFRHAARSARHQATFLSYLDELGGPAPGDGTALGAGDLPGWVTERFGVPPVVVDVPSMDVHAVVKAVIPSADFLIPRSAGGYIVAPGYLD